ncbi:MAG: hypothetical protein CVU65_13445 [Deltaproteobacteria bacterium HGW-Deltaproteobacteria-22]|nr:MAG: hypothetical protein CVU65_13445 [Deltaproteobacteria bacterium HGW-Deltaproteobacteria-22]
MKYCFTCIFCGLFLFADTGADTGADADADAGPTIPPEWFEADPLGRTTADNRIEALPEMIIVSDDELAPAWEEYAVLRSLEGRHTMVVRMSGIPPQFAGTDDAQTLQNFLRDQWQRGTLRFVLLGGDAGRVPFRRVDNAISIPVQGDNYVTNGPSESYFANVEATWDGDGDGRFGEKDQDFSLATAREAQLAVGRVSADTVAEVRNYLDKVVIYRTYMPGYALRSLLLSDVASTMPVIGDIDAAEGIESTFAAFFPPAFGPHVQKLYATSTACTMYDAEPTSPGAVKTALESYVPLVFHNGHGSHRWMTNDINRDFVDALSNELPAVFASCSCLSGNFADVASTASSPWEAQTPENDSAGERWILGRRGGVAYIGNTGTGLGPIGGSQFLHAFFEGLFAQALPTIGEIFNYARSRMREIPFTLSYLSTVMTDDSEWWTHHVLILLGDPSLPVWTQDPLKLELETPATYGPGYQTITVTVRVAGGSTRAGVSVTFHKPGDFRVTLPTDDNGQVSFSFIPRGPEFLHVGASAPDCSFISGRITPDLPSEVWP